ncbi:hypothetical protein AMTR_s00062p00138120 [Amborella trichopoda]|uniref:Cytochrome P450 n=1 Tax=Amborella trichopoda TaxID=13333 RepID=U5DGS1_AMBTC|nr:hypothetical protein AMTR_s00062p00138120 [Amborella trichopoda]
MDASIFMSLLLLLASLPFFLLLIARRRSEKLPPGSLGIPLVGNSLALLRAMRNDRAEKWIEEKIRKHGPIFKVTLFGCPTVALSGSPANKFIFTAKDDTFINQQPRPIQRILGERTLLDVSGEDHKRLRTALSMFLRPEVLKEDVRKMDKEVGRHLDRHWEGWQELKVLKIGKLDWPVWIENHWGRFDKNSRFNRSLSTSNRVRKVLAGLIRVKKAQVGLGSGPLHKDLITSLVSIKGEDGRRTLSEDEMIDNVILAMVAGHDTSSILMTFLIRLLAMDSLLYAGVYNEQVEVARAKVSDEPLTWDDRGKMKYTWRLALETLRIIPPIFGSFKKAMRDIHYGGYLIPKGWQVSDLDSPSLTKVMPELDWVMNLGNVGLNRIVRADVSFREAESVCRTSCDSCLSNPKAFHKRKLPLPDAGSCLQFVALPRERFIPRNIQ